MSKYTSATLTAAIAALDAAGYPATYSDALSKSAAIGPRSLAREASIMNCKYVAPDARDDDRIGAEQANAALAALIIEIVSAGSESARRAELEAKMAEYIGATESHDEYQDAMRGWLATPDGAELAELTRE